MSASFRYASVFCQLPFPPMDYFDPFSLIGDRVAVLLMVCPPSLFKPPLLVVSSISAIPSSLCLETSHQHVFLEMDVVVVSPSNSPSLTLLPSPILFPALSPSLSHYGMRLFKIKKRRQFYIVSTCYIISREYYCIACSVCMF